MEVDPRTKSMATVEAGCGMVQSISTHWRQRARQWGLGRCQNKSPITGPGKAPTHYAFLPALNPKNDHVRPAARENSGARCERRFW